MIVNRGRPQQYLIKIKRLLLGGGNCDAAAITRPVHELTASVESIRMCVIMSTNAMQGLHLFAHACTLKRNHS
jgi:hypothetical protein